MKLKIEKIDRSRTVTFTDKTGQPKTLPKIGICSGGRWYGAFQAAWNNSWSEGEEVDVEVTEQKRGDKTFYNIAPVSAEKKVLEEMNAKLDRILKFMEIIYSEGHKPTETKSVGFGNDQESEPNTDDSDVPFKEAT